MFSIDDEFKASIGQRLKKLREDKNYSINKVVEIMTNNYRWEVNEKSIRRYEKGESLPKIDNLIYLAKLYDTTLDYIVYGRELSDDNSFTWYDNFKRLNRLLYTMQVKMCRDREKVSDVYLQLLDDEAKEWFGIIERYKENRKNMFTHKGLEKEIAVKDLDALFKEFKKDRTQLLPIEERARRSFLTAQPIITTKVQEENGEITIISKIHRQ